MDKFTKYEPLLSSLHKTDNTQYKESFILSIYTDLFEKDTVSLSMLHDYIVQIAARSMMDGMSHLNIIIAEWCDLACTYRMKPTQFALDLIDEYKRRNTDESEVCFVMPTFLGLESTSIKPINDVALPLCLKKIEDMYVKTL